MGWQKIACKRSNRIKQVLKQLFGWIVWMRCCKNGFMHADNIYLNTNENDRKATGYSATRDYRYIQEIKERYPLHKL